MQDSLNVKLSTHDKLISQQDQYFLMRWYTRGLSIILGSSVLMALSYSVGSSIGLGLNWLFMMNSIALLIIAPGSTEQKGSTDWAKSHMYNIFVINGYLFFLSSIYVCYAVLGFTFLSFFISSSLFLTVAKLNLEFHDIYFSDVISYLLEKLRVLNNSKHIKSN